MRVERIGDATLYLGDCLEVLPTLGKVDAVVTDPPYGLGERMKGGTWGAADKYSDMRKWDVVPATETITKISCIGAAIIWGGNYFNFPPSRCWLIWDKVRSIPTLADFEMAWTNLDRPAKRFYFRGDTNDTGHPTQKPVALMRWCLGFVPNAVTILDPFTGSGTTGVACAQLGRKFIGIEIEPKYFDIACERIAAAYAQGRLFEPERIEPETKDLFPEGGAARR